MMILMSLKSDHSLKACYSKYFIFQSDSLPKYNAYCLFFIFLYILAKSFLSYLTVYLCMDVKQNEMSLQ